MVTGDHHGADAGALGIGHCSHRFGAGRVDHRDQADKDIALLVIQREFTDAVQLPAAKGQHTQTLLGEVVVYLHDLLPVLLGEGADPIGGHDPVRALQQHIDGALGHQGGDSLDLLQGGHQFAVGVKGQLGQPLMLAAVSAFLHTEVFAQQYQSHLGGVTDGGATLLVVGGIAGQQCCFEQQALGIVGQFQILAVAELAIGIDLFYGHAVLGEGTGLIRTDDRDSTQAFHRLEFLDDGILLGHLLGSDGQYNGDD